MSELPVIDLAAKLIELRNEGWIKSIRKGPTGLGKTLETRLGIVENNKDNPDCVFRGKETEVKGHRISSGSMITLFTLEPGIRKLDDLALMDKYGYIASGGRRNLYCTLTDGRYNQQGLKLDVRVEEGTISIVDSQGEIPWKWTLEEIKLKIHSLCVVHCDSKKSGEEEYFMVKSATFLDGLDVDCFFRLFKNRKAKIDLRMHVEPDDGSDRNHGTAFRIRKWDDVGQCYSIVETLF